MTEFTTKFEIEDAATIDGAWSPADFISINSSDVIASAGSGISIASRNAANSGTVAARAVVVDTLPTTAQQEIAIACGSALEGTVGTQFVECGIGALSSPTDFSADPWGIYARLGWESDGVRVLSLRRFLRGDAADTEVAAITLVAAGTIEADGYAGLLNEAGALSTPQLLRLVVVTTDSGMRATVYLNTWDDDRPVLTANIGTDFVPPTVSTTDFGSWWFGFGTSASAESLAVAMIIGSDYDVDEVTEEQDLSDNQPTYAELEQRVRSRYEGGISTNISQQRILDALRDEVEYLINRCGDVAWFLIREEAITLTVTARGLMTLPAKMRRALEIVTANGERIPFKFNRLTTAGATVIEIPSLTTGAHTIRYVMRHKQLVEPGDLCPIPREHAELVMAGAIKRLAVRDRNIEALKTYTIEHNMHEALFLRDNNRFSDQRRAVWRPRMVHGAWYRRHSSQVFYSP